jgi:hypothetical protein
VRADWGCRRTFRRLRRRTGKLCVRYNRDKDLARPGSSSAARAQNRWVDQWRSALRLQGPRRPGPLFPRAPSPSRHTMQRIARSRQVAASEGGLSHSITAAEFSADNIKFSVQRDPIRLPLYWSGRDLSLCPAVLHVSGESSESQAEPDIATGSLAHDDEVSTPPSVGYQTTRSRKA